MVAAPTTSLPETSAAPGTGTTATPGCATRPSRPSPSSAWASTTRHAFNEWLEDRLHETADDPSCRSSTASRRVPTSPSTAGPPGGVPRTRAGADRQRGPRPAPARRLRRAHGRGLPRQQGRADQLGAVADLRRLLDWLADNWHQPDKGIWEVRGGRRDFVYSRLMCWVAFERAMRMQSQRGLPATPTGGAPRGTRSTRRSWRGDGARAPGLRAVLRRRRPRRQQPPDAARQVHRGRATRGCSPRSTRSSEELVSDSLVYRYDPERLRRRPGRRGRGRFSLCSFWLVECLTRAGRLDEARLVFEKMLSYANNLGLLRRADRRDRRGPRQLPAGLHAPGAHLRRLGPRQGPRRRLQLSASAGLDGTGPADGAQPHRGGCICGLLVTAFGGTGPPEGQQPPDGQAPAATSRSASATSRAGK